MVPHLLRNVFRATADATIGDREAERCWVVLGILERFLVPCHSAGARAHAERLSLQWVHLLSSTGFDSVMNPDVGFAGPDEHGFCGVAAVTAQRDREPRHVDVLEQCTDTRVPWHNARLRLFQINCNASPVRDNKKKGGIFYHTVRHLHAQVAKVAERILPRSACAGTAHPHPRRTNRSSPEHAEPRDLQDQY